MEVGGCCQALRSGVVRYMPVALRRASSADMPVSPAACTREHRLAARGRLGVRAARRLHIGADMRDTTQRGRILTMLVLTTVPAAFGCAGAGEQPSADEPGVSAMKIEIPQSMRAEHTEIHDALAAATRKPGRVGEAARDLATILHPHFVRDEQVALPPLGLLEPLARGARDPSMDKVLPMTDALRAELPAMLRQHVDIAAAARRLEAVAREEKDAEVEHLARKLQEHAKSEEEILYPAAILVGEVVRSRLGSTR